MASGGKVLTQPRVNLSGKKFGRWTVGGFERHHKGKGFLWNVVCDCGNRNKKEASKLTSGTSQSCGCAVAETLGARSTKHGFYGTPIYRIWSGIIARCENRKGKDYKWYGGRGIKICAEWRHDVIAFSKAVGHCPGKGFSIDRIDPNGNYEPGNVKWSTIIEQNSNKRTNVILSFRGETMTLPNMARKYHLPPSIVWARLHSGWTIDRALSEKLYLNYHNYKRLYNNAAVAAHMERVE